MKASIVITTYNRPQMLRLCLAALAKQDEFIHEVIVSDDGSSSGNYEEMGRISRSSPLNVTL
ncbi:MAG: glycosyltransferase, partial [Lentisphaerae bacterium]|nr:glycosyltransferase [Lentisphaerota bacterium]